MTIIKIRRGKSHHKVGIVDTPYFDYYKIESADGAIPKLTPLHSLTELQPNKEDE